MSEGKMLTCATCGNEEPEGTRFCRSCGVAFVPVAAEPSRAEPPPPPLPSPGGKGRRRWIVVGAVVALLVAGGAAAAALSMSGGGGGSDQAGGNSESGFDATDVLPPDDTSTEVDATGVDCEQLTSFVEDFPRGLSVDPTNPEVSREVIDEVTEALSELASGAPADVRQDFETVSEAWRGVAEAVSDLGLEAGDVPDDEQVDRILELSAVFDDPEFLDASTTIADWMDSAVTQCSLGGTETSDAGDTTVGDETTTEAGADGGEGVDATCDGFLVMATLARKDDPSPSVDDVERLATIVSGLASKAPAEPLEAGTFLTGEPKDSLEDIAQGLESYARLLSELGLEPGSDAALDEPRIAEVIEGMQDADADLTSWFKERCNQEDLAAFETIRNG